MEALIRVLVGPGQREFIVHRALLCASSPFFRDSIDAVPAGLSSSSDVFSPSLDSSPARAARAARAQPTSIWLAGESAEVFELFIIWLYRRHAFRSVVDDAVTILAREAKADDVIELLPEGATSSTSLCTSNLSALHWHLVHLHLFAALVDLPALQDAVMDALQDLYLRFDWAATPALVRFLYVEADPAAALRLRKWAVALLAWTLANGADASPPELLPLLRIDALAADYHAHVTKMLASRADVRIKNPQLRIAGNHLRREDRHFGFRQCSFHGHRRAVGQGRCPHARQAKPLQKGSAHPVVSFLFVGLHSLLLPVRPQNERATAGRLAGMVAAVGDDARICTAGDGVDYLILGPPLDTLSLASVRMTAALRCL